MGDGSVHGVTRCLALWIPRYDAARFEASVCNIRGRDPGVEHLEGLGIPVAQLGRGRLDPRAIADLRALVQRERVHLLHLHGYGATNFGRIVARTLGMPAVVHEHFIDPRVPPYQQVADRLLAGLSSWGFAVSEAVRGFMVARRFMPAARVEVVPNGAALDPFAQAGRRGSGGAAVVRRSLGVPVDEPVVAIVGRLAPIKDHDLFLRAAAMVVSRIPRVTFVIVGEGELESALRQQVSELGLAGQVVFAGYRADIPAVLGAVDLLVSTSQNEGFGLTLIEAMATGCAVVATRVGGVPEVIDDGRTGLLVPPADAAASAEAWLRLLGDAGLRASLGAAAEREAVRRFDVKETVRRLEARYGTLLRR
jgi:glycosyltransferase involved in cell wall biosynthesis